MAEYLHIRLFRGLTVSLNEGPAHEFRPNLTGNLLAYLALYADHAHPRERLADLLWPDEPDTESARHKLRQSLRQLRIKLNEIEDGLADRALLTNPATVRLNPELVRVDLGEFLHAAERADRANDPSERQAQLATAADLYRGELLPGFYQEAFAAERERLAATYRSVLAKLLDALEEAGRTEEALAIARRVAAEDPLHEDAHIRVMRLHALLGQPGEVTRQYQALARALQSELDAAPAEKTRAFYETLLAESRARASERPMPPAPPAPPTPAAMTPIGVNEAPERAVLPAPAPVGPGPRAQTPARFWRRGRLAAAAAGVVLLAALGLTFSPRRKAPTPAIAGQLAVIPVEWEWSYPPEEDEKPGAEPTAIAVGRDGSIYVTGFIQTKRRDVDFLTVRLSPDGQPIWAKTFNGANNDVDRARSLVVDDEGSVYVLGDSDMGRGKGQTRLSGLDLVVVKYDSAGKELWVRAIDGGFNGEDRAVKILLDNMGDIIVGGNSWGPAAAHGGDSDDWLFARLDRATGRPLWKKRFDGGAHFGDSLADFCVGPSSDVFATGGGARPSEGTMTGDVLTMRIDTRGKMVARVRHPSGLPGSSRGVRIALGTASGPVYVAAVIHKGDPGVGGTGEEIALIAYNQDLARVFDHVVAGTNDDDIPTDLALLPNGNIVLGGRQGGDFSSFIFKPDGGIPKLLAANGLGNTTDFVRRVLISRRGTILAVGVLVNGSREEGGSMADIGVIEYAPDGKQLGFARHDVARYGDNVADAALCPDGTLAVVSQSNVTKDLLTFHVVKFRP